MAGPDFVNTLKEEDVKKVVYAAKDKQYMQGYLKLLGVLHGMGLSKAEPTLDYVAQEASKNLLLYGIISERSRNAPSRDSGLLFHTHISKDEKSGLIDTTLEINKENGLVFLLESPGEKVNGIFPIDLVNDLRECELRLLEQRQASNCT